MKRISVILPIVCLIALIASSCNQDKSKITWFDKPGECVETVSVKVFQALGNNTALAECYDEHRSIGYYDRYGEPMVLLYNDEGNLYYDDQIVEATKGQCFRQVGIYRYTNQSDFVKTVPVVKLMK